MSHVVVGHLCSRSRHFIASVLLVFTLSTCLQLRSQDGSTALQGVVEDISGARVPTAHVLVKNYENGFHREAVTDAAGNFDFGMLPPGHYDVSAYASGMTSGRTPGLQLYVGGVFQIELRLAPSAQTESVTVNAQVEPLDVQSGDVSSVVAQDTIEGLPLNGRRFTDLALLAPYVTQDPRGLTSDSNGDLSVGGIRGWQNNFQVDGTDNNNSFFAQARGRYRAPYQFSDEVIKEFRVSTNSYSAEQGRSGGLYSMS